MTPLEITTDPHRMSELIDPLVSRDPVGGTVLATILTAAVNGSGDGAWCAADPISGEVAARSGGRFPVVVSDDFPPGRIPELSRALLELPGLRRLAGRPSTLDVLTADLGRAVTSRTDERLYRCDAVIEPRAAAPCRVADGSFGDLVVTWTRAFMLEEFGPDTPDNSEGIREAVELGLVWLATNADEATAMAVRRPVAHGVARIGPVYTPPAQRSRGYGSAVTAAATRSVLDEAAMPVLFTNLANPTSNKIYQALGYRPVADRASVELASG